MCKELRMVKPFPGMVIKESVTFMPGEYHFPEGNGITIAAANIVIDGSGARLIGPGSTAEGKESFRGTGVFSEGTSGCTIKNLTVRGFRRGIHLRKAANWTIVNNDLSYNYHDPDFGWGDGPTYGGLLCEYVTDSLIAGNVGRENWNGLDLRWSDRNTIRKNEFSHCSNVCLRMWGACRNLIEDNDFSWGIRISPGEVHARDSSSLLMESGSNGNRFLRNNFTHGGDGIFIRSLNGWVSEDNYFEENDCSYANNNAVECWSPRNTFVRNKANHSSYGFWLGGSDCSVLIGNEVRYNGGYFPGSYQNAPEPFGNAGIAIVNGSGSHTKLIGNDIQFNRGPGLAIRHSAATPSYHWLIQDNIIANNIDDPRGYRGHGIFLEHAHWVDIIGNEITGNDGEAVYQGENTRAVTIIDQLGDYPMPQVASVMEPQHIRCGESVTLRAVVERNDSGFPLSYQWEFGDGTQAAGQIVLHTYEKPGFYRAALTVSDGRRADLSYLDIYVLPQGEFLDLTADQWTVVGKSAQLNNDPKHSISGQPSLLLTGDQELDYVLSYPEKKQLGVRITPQLTLGFWLQVWLEAYSKKDHFRPVIRLHQDAANYLEFTPNNSYFVNRLYSPFAEGRGGWLPVEIPVGEDCTAWSRSVVGEPHEINWFEIKIGPNSPGKCFVWIDGLQWVHS